MRKINPFLTTTIYFTWFFFLSFSTLDTYATSLIYTIQTGSFQIEEDAQEHFDSLVQGLDEKALSYLRIEKIKKFYALRLGKFENRVHAEKFLQENKEKLPEAIVLSAYYIEERILRKYKSTSLSKKPQIEKIKPPVNKKADIDITHEPVEKQIQIISALVDKKDLENALKVTKIAIAAQPEDPEINGWYGTVLLKLDHPDKAIHYFKKASELSPDVTDYHNGIGYCLSFLNRFDEAIYEFTKSVMLDPDNIDAIAGLGIAYGKIGQNDKALIFYNKLKDLDRDTANKVLQIIKKETS